MSEAMKRRWWRAAVAAVIGVSAAGGGWFGVTRFVRAEPAPLWTRAQAPPAAAPVVVPAAAAPAPAAPPVVTPAVFTAPADATAGRVIPASAMTPVIPPRPDTPTADALPVTPAAAVVIPEFHAAAPLSVSAKAAADPVAPPLPPLPIPGDAAKPPTPPPAPPATLPLPTALPPLPDTPVFKPAAKPSPVVPMPPDFAPPPVKAVEPPKPAAPPTPDFNLRPVDRANSVKTDGTGPAFKAVPVEAAKPLPTPPQPTAEADRPKPADAALPPSDKYVFPLPANTAAAAPALPTSRSAQTGVLPTPLSPEPAGTGIAAPLLPGRATETPDTRAPAPGDRTMTFKQSAVAAVTGGALAFAPAAPAAVSLPPVAKSIAFAPQPPVAVVPPAPVAIDPLEAGIPPVRAAVAQPAKDPVKDKAADEKLTEIQRDLKRLTELLDGRRDSDGTRNPSDVGLVEEMKRLKDKIYALENQVTELKKTTTLRPTPAPAPTPPPVAADPLAGKGQVLVINDYQVEITIVVNSNSYRVAANTELKIPVPVGEFTYQLLSAGANLAPTKSVIKEKEIVKLRVK